MARHGTAWRGMARHGAARHGAARFDSARQTRCCGGGGGMGCAMAHGCKSGEAWEGRGGGLGVAARRWRRHESGCGVRPEATGRKPAASACERRRFRRTVPHYGWPRSDERGASLVLRESLAATDGDPPSKIALSEARDYPPSSSSSSGENLGRTVDSKFANKRGVISRRGN